MILQESGKRWGPEQASRYSAAIDIACAHVGDHPEIGIAQPRFPGVRSLPVESHLLLYRETTHGVRILRIVHQRKNLEDVKLR